MMITSDNYSVRPKSIQVCGRVRKCVWFHGNICIFQCINYIETILTQQSEDNISVSSSSKNPSSIRKNIPPESLWDFPCMNAGIVLAHIPIIPHYTWHSTEAYRQGLILHKLRLFYHSVP